MSQKRFSKEGFQRLYHGQSEEDMATTGGNPNDATIDIPLTKVTSSRSTTGARKPTDTTINISQSNGEVPEVLNEKHSHFHRGRRRKLDATAKGNKDSKDGSLNAMGRLYNKIYHFSIVTRYMLYVVPIAALIAIPIVIGATVAPNARIGGSTNGVRMLYFCVWLEIFWCSLWVSKVVAHFLPYIFQFLVGVVSAGTRKYSLILAALEFPLSLVGWAVTSVVTIKPIMTQTPGNAVATNANWIDILQKILFACLFSTLILLIEKVLIQLISISYHRKQFDDKIKASKRNIYLTTRLYEGSRVLFPMYCQEFAEEDYTMTDVLGLDGLGSRDSKGHKRSGSATPMKLIHNVQRVGDKVTSAFGNVASEITGKQVFNPTSAHSIVIQALEKKRSSEALARRLWLSFVLEGHDALYLDDIVDVFGPDHKDEAEEMFFCLDADGNGDVSLDEMILRIGEFGRERAALANSMRDVDQAIRVLDSLLMTVVFVLSIFIFIAWLNRNFTTTLATAGTALLSMSFVFSATAQELLGSCIFLFVKHPYDVGDRVDISSESMVVEKISLLYSIFRKVNDHKRTQIPHIVLNSLWIDNISRSKAMREQLSIFVSFDTSFEDMEFLRKEMEEFVCHKDNARDFQPDVEVECIGIAEMNKMELRIEIRHKSNWSNETVRAARRSKFMCALVLALRKIPIYAPGGGGAAAGDKANPTYSVAISDSQAQINKDEFAQKKEAARMIPSTKNDDHNDLGKTTSFDKDVEARERATIQTLNQRRPIVDPVRDGMDDLNREKIIIDRQRSHDLDEVKNILRRESVSTGRRKASQVSPVMTRASEDQKWNSIPEGPSLTPQALPPRVSYYEDNGFAQNTPQIQVSGPTTQYPQYPQHPTRLQTQQPPMRPGDIVASPTTYEQTQPPQQVVQSSQGQTGVTPRRPMAGPSDNYYQSSSGAQR